jgi:hypothetical protein
MVIIWLCAPLAMFLLALAGAGSARERPEYLSYVGREDRWLIAREKLRRYVQGAPMLSVVDARRGD